MAIYQLSVVRFFVENPKKIKSLEDYFQEALNVSAGAGHIDVVKYMIGVLRKKENFQYFLDDSLIAAAIKGHLDIVKYLIRQGANVNANDGEAFVLSAEYNHSDVIKCLIANGVKIKSNNGEAIRWIVQNGNLDVLQFLIEYARNFNIDINENLKETLRIAVEHGDLDVLHFLIEHARNFNIDINEKLKETLRIAVGNSDLDVLQFLIEYARNSNIDIDAKLTEALRIAVDNSDYEIIRCLVENGADIHVDDDYPLVKSNELEIIQYLVEHGANIDARRGTALFRSINCEQWEIVEYLVEHGATITNDALRLSETYAPDIFDYLVFTLSQQGQYVGEYVEQSNFTNRDFDKCVNSEDPITFESFNENNSWTVSSPSGHCISPSTVRQWWQEKGASRSLLIDDEEWELWNNGSNKYEELFNFQGCKEGSINCRDLWSKKLQEESELTREEIDKLIEITRILLGLDVEGLKNFIEQNQGYPLNDSQKREFKRYIEQNNRRAIKASRDPKKWIPSLEPLKLGNNIINEYTIWREIAMGKFAGWIEENPQIGNLDLNGEPLRQRVNRCTGGLDCITVLGVAIKNKLKQLYEIIIIPDEYQKELD